MDAAELAHLHGPRTFPAVSLIMQTHRRPPENKQDPLRLKNLLDEAARRLGEQDLPRRMADEVLRNLEKAAAQVDLRHAAEAMVLLAAPGGEHHVYVLPRVNVAERVVIADTFATRDLVAMLEKTWSYWVLVMSEQPTRLWSGDGEQLIEVSNALFPTEFHDTLPDQRGPAPSQRKQSRIEEDRRGQFFRQVEQNLAEVLKTDPRPVVVLGVPRYLTYLDELASRPVKDAIIGTVEGSFDKVTAAELAALVGPGLREAHEATQYDALAKLEQARSDRRFADGLSEVWSLAADGRVALLLVEEGFMPPGRTAGSRLLPPDSTEGTPVPDVVDDLIENVLTTSGEVIFVPDEALAARGRIAAITRY